MVGERESLKDSLWGFLHVNHVRCGYRPNPAPGARRDPTGGGSRPALRPPKAAAGQPDGFGLSTSDLSTSLHVVEHVTQLIGQLVGRIGIT